MANIPPDQLAFEIDDIIRCMPSKLAFSTNPDDCSLWLGRASAAISKWSLTKAITVFEPLIDILSVGGDSDLSVTLRKVLVLLHQALSELRMATAGPLSVAVGTGRVFEYFDEVRKLVELAKIDAFFIDPYIDADFVSRYLPFVPTGTEVRILARERLATLEPSIKAFAAQTPMKIEVRSASGFHDRYILVDSLACYQSGASFQDGAKRTPTTLTQITDAFSAVQQTHEALWLQGAVVVKV